MNRHLLLLALCQGLFGDADIGNAGPDRAEGIGAWPTRRDEGAQTRARPGGVDHEICDRRPPAERIHGRRPAIRPTLDIDDFPARLDIAAGVAKGLPQRAMQGRAVNADGIVIGAETGIREVEDRAAGVGQAVQAPDARTEGFDSASQSEASQRREACRLQHETGANGLRLGEALIERDAMAGAGEQRSDGQAADPGPDQAAK